MTESSGRTNGPGENGPGAIAQSATRHGSIRLVEPACTSCMICARECPSWCITIDSHTEPTPDLPAGVRERTRNVLDRFAIDWSLCMYCGICVDECPFDALEWVAQPTTAGLSLLEEMASASHGRAPASPARDARPARD